MQIPTPFAVGRVNCYLIEDEPLTLVDTGPNSGKSLDELEHQLSALGRSIDELELVVLTHQHIDHLGLVEIIASRSGAEVAAIDVVVPFIENFGNDVELEDRFAASLMLRHGIPEDVVTALRSVSRSFRAWGLGLTSLGLSTTARSCGFAIVSWRSSTAPGTARRTRCSGTRIGESCCAQTI